MLGGRSIGALGCVQGLAGAGGRRSPSRERYRTHVLLGMWRRICQGMGDGLLRNHFHYCSSKHVGCGSVSAAGTLVACNTIPRGSNHNRVFPPYNKERNPIHHAGKQAGAASVIGGASVTSMYQALEHEPGAFSGPLVQPLIAAAVNP